MRGEKQRRRENIRCQQARVPLLLISAGIVVDPFGNSFLFGYKKTGQVLLCPV
jgi:hypothetical protein